MTNPETIIARIDNDLRQVPPRDMTAETIEQWNVLQPKLKQDKDDHSS